ncbi:ABC-type bacteriocin/lantibiotic exporter with double-glycine peptidase domain [Vibrio crassostreae]|uniref:ABC transporter transmembrane domain-containing protein n=1 Tax=Vibrio crassostreae TaxID=246167 RepID=UPI0010537F95|nr:ABC transporter transmembrane domain-containing protein [Vibrio crassostreae]TCN83460.1 ABC-type bacteriocin/lantibiotic exporter with double-glycine peptidase domain [Vibrio crassostreae]CAK2413245.1 ABC-type bacteriocin/lantibiotic exporter with double-glycine peptidase domain [Vibrio crassostreae]CAK2422921.1 ABC-type bacteriocin/lantibiotic exporter with double-glycine peptidase domain [Vibrio crassostreae]CAK2696468.1 ABC-type bacteriocin/lantibiotic exporter with double-glycine peptida
MPASSMKNKGVVGKVLLPSLLINLLSLAVPLTVLQIYDRILPNQSYGTATLLLAGATLAVAMEALIRFVRTWLLSAAASNTEKATYQTLVERVTNASSGHIRHLGVGGVEEGLGSVSKVKDWYSGGVIAGFIDLPFALIFLGLVAYIGGELVAIPLAVWLITLGIVWLSSIRVKSLSEEASRDDQDRKAFLILLSQTIQGIKRQAVESRIFNQFKSLNNVRSQSKAREEEQNAFAQECIQLAALATSVLLVITGSLWVLDGQLTTGGLAACSILSGRAVAPLSALVGVRIKLNSIHSANQAIEKLNDLSLSEFSDSEQPETPLSDFETLEIKQATVERYGELSHADVTLNKGELVLLESEDRHTNSHLLSSIAGIDDLKAGECFINGAAVSIASVTNIAAYCGVKGQLVSGTILDNLCGFDPERTQSANEYAKRLGLTKEITRLPDGLETQIGHTSASLLSMGNVKMLNIATQLASDKPVIMLERPDSSLDLDALGNLAKVLEEEVAAGRTLLVVSYHSKLRELANRIITVESRAITVESEIKQEAVV